MHTNIRLSPRERAVLEKLIADSEATGHDHGIVQNAHVPDLGPKQFAGVMGRLAQKGLIELPGLTVFRLGMGIAEIRRILSSNPS